MKPVLVGTLIPFPLIWIVGGWQIALFSVVGALAIFGGISYAVNRGWIK